MVPHGFARESTSGSSDTNVLVCANGWDEGSVLEIGSALEEEEITFTTNSVFEVFTSLVDGNEDEQGSIMGEKDSDRIRALNLVLFNELRHAGDIDGPTLSL
ncbi:hypothetical protein J6590_060091 [Homalodisca vitripennis]|nr:hypothetical protein J6590_060091 [Homalodisca vitripennis]